jgi:nucleoside-diphosphate-sugar epimerase
MTSGRRARVSNFVIQALRNENITIYGEGQQTRSFCYVDDLVEGLIRLIETPDDVTGPINLGNPVEFTIRQLAELVIELTGSSSKVVFNRLPGRSQAALSRHQPRQVGARMAAENSASRRSQEND